MPDEPCQHEDFNTSLLINRILSSEDEGPPVRFNAGIRVTCANCGVPFQFIGLPHGVDLDGASVSADGEEGRFCIAPKGEVVSALEGPSGFTVRRRIP